MNGRGTDSSMLRLLIVIYAVLLLVYIFSMPGRLFDKPLCTVVEASDGKLLGARIADDGQWRFPPSDCVPEKFAQAVTAFEDQRFRYHPGVDPVAVLRAVCQNITKGTTFSGASTISMQVIRLSRNGKSRTVKEKLIEAILATRLELSYSKKNILAMYASNAPFGGNVVGLDAAAWRYFGRSADDLSWAESATLAVLPNSPSLIHVARNRDKLREKRDFLLNTMCERGIITKLDLDLALSEPLPDKPYNLPMEAPHLTDRIRRENLNKPVQTTLDYDLQKRINRIIDDRHKSYRANRVENMAVLVAEVNTGRILAYCGNIYRSDDDRYGSNVDVIISPRSSGSIFKPFLYAGMLDDGDILPDMLIADYPFHFRGFSPKNFNRTFDGAVPAHRVLERSLNVPTVRMLQEYGINKFHHILRRSGFTTINRPSDDYGLSLILGGAECTLWDAVQAYMAMAQKLNSLTDTGARIYNLRYNSEQTGDSSDPADYPFGFASVWLTFESLSKLNRPEEESDWQVYSSSRKIAWKTGTSYGNRDAWSIGVTPEYVVGVWVGNADGEGRTGLTGIGYAAPVMFDIFNILPSSSWFGMPEYDMISEPVCRKSGHLATYLCEEVDSLWIPRQGMESRRCPYHIPVNLSRDRIFRVNSDCYEVSDMIRTSWFVLPPAMEWYYRTKNADYSSLPPVHPQCYGIESSAPMELIYPQPGMTVVLPRKLDSSDNRIIFHAVHRDSRKEIHWHIDGDYIGTTRGDHFIAVQPDEGRHLLTLVDSEGNTIRTGFFSGTD
ncbi:MAG: penicillin-binding protein 1C [Rikenellaceae bacterium]|nr:penicillin-binding protein 1C [Rikenellaceae bacterium]